MRPLRPFVNRKSEIMHISFGICAFFISSLLFAQEKHTAANVPQMPSASGSVFTMLLGLIVVLGIMAGIAWLVKRSGLSGVNRHGLPIKVVGGTNIGTRERVMVIEVDDQWIVIGVTPSNITTLATMHKKEFTATPDTETTSPNFATWLKQTIEKRK